MTISGNATLNVESVSVSLGAAYVDDGIDRGSVQGAGLILRRRARPHHAKHVVDDVFVVFHVHRGEPGLDLLSIREAEP
jgi:hypothetical protein